MKELKLGILLLVVVGSFFLNIYHPGAGSSALWLVLIVLAVLFHRLTGEELLSPIEGPIKSLDLAERALDAERAEEQRPEPVTVGAAPEQRLVSGWPRKLGYLAAAIVGFGIAGFGTIPTIHKIYQLTGRIGGASEHKRIIKSKWTERERRVTYYMLSWGEGNQRDYQKATNVERDIWNAARIGDKIDLLRVPGDDHAYLAHNDIFARRGLSFDYTLLAAELLFGCWALFKFVTAPARRTVRALSTMNDGS